MKYFTPALSFLAISSWFYSSFAIVKDCQPQTSDFINYQLKYNKSYDTPEEYNYRYEKGAGGHASEHIIRDTYPKNLGDMNERKKVNEPVGMTPPPQCIPDYLKLDDPVEAYRQYYLIEKTDLLSYTKRNVPQWIIDMGMGEHK